jgi:uncharacterized membrane protein YgaE (UPF0421/DUF939 family)
MAAERQKAQVNSSDAPGWIAAMPDFRRRLVELLVAQRGPPIGLSYALRTASAGCISLLAYPLLGAQAGIWAVVSAVVVTQPDTRGSVAAAALRMVANILGAGVGLLVSELLGAQQLVALAAGLLIVAFVCHTLRLDATARTASASLAIVLLKDPSGVLGSSGTRVLGVVAGCAVAFIVTVVAVELERWSRD